MNCPQCKSDIAEGRNFCNKCGCKLEKDNITPLPITPHEDICPQCSALIMQGQKFCKKCGYSLEAENKNAISLKNGKRKKTVIVSACSILIVAIAVIGFTQKDTLFTLMQKDDIIVEDSPSSTGTLVSAAPSFVEPESVSSVPPDRGSQQEKLNDITVTPSEQEESVSINPALFETRLVLDPQWDNVTVFDEHGLARVNKGKYWRLIDKSGSYTGRQDYTSIGNFYEGLAAVCRNGKYGYIDALGNEVILPKWDNAYGFNEGLARVSDNGMYGYIDTNGKLITDGFPFTNAKAFAGGYAPIQLYKNDSYFLLDRDSLKTFSGDWGFFTEMDSFSEGLAACKDLFQKDWGYVDQSQTTVIPFIYTAANKFENGTAIVEQSGKQFHIDRNGIPVTVKTDKIWGFSDGYATALVGSKYGFIDRDTGDFAIPPQYVDVYGFADGLAPVAIETDFWVYIDKNNELQFNGEAWEEAFKFHGGIAKVKNEGRFGFIDRNGNEIEPVQWDDATSMSENMIGVCINGQWGFLEVMAKDDLIYYK